MSKSETGSICFYSIKIEMQFDSFLNPAEKGYHKKKENIEILLYFFFYFIFFFQGGKEEKKDGIAPLGFSFQSEDFFDFTKIILICNDQVRGHLKSGYFSKSARSLFSAEWILIRFT